MPGFTSSRSPATPSNTSSTAMQPPLFFTHSSSLAPYLLRCPKAVHGFEPCFGGQAIAEGDPRPGDPRPPGCVGGSEAKKNLKKNLKSASHFRPFNKFHFFSEEDFLMWARPLNGDPRSLNGEPKPLNGQPKTLNGQPKTLNGEPRRMGRSTGALNNPPPTPGS